MRKIIFLLNFILLNFMMVRGVQAEEKNSFVTIVNPVRVSAYNSRPGDSLKAEYQEIKKRNFPATWLLTFDAFSNEAVVSVVKTFDQKQELGIFLEIAPNLAKAAGVEYRDTGFWHHATSVFLSGYTQEERKKLMDAVFEKFKEVFGFYPTSVGSWWTDSYSLAYMQEKYGITANLSCSDQFTTDGYMIWGTPWQMPYYPSKFHAGISAPLNGVKLDLVNLQWAARDPLNGYYSSLFSTQDYLVAGKDLDIRFFEKLIDLYTDSSINSFGQIVLGLEADLSPEVYSQEYAKQMEVISRKLETEGLKLVTMFDFSQWYRDKFPDLSPALKTQSDDLLGSGRKVIWYQTLKYRVGIRFEEGKATIFDLRFYSESQQEPYYLSPNREFNLFINNFSLIDEGSNQHEAINVKGEPQDFSFLEDKFLFKGKELVKTSDLTERITEKVFKDFSSEAIHFFKQRKFPLYLIKGIGWDYLKKVNYLIPEGEKEALFKLSLKPKGKVLVYDTECLQCEYHTEFKPPALANIRSYVSLYAGKKITRNQKVFNAKTREQSLKEFEKTKAKYIYLVKFEGYLEKLPYSPGDLGVEKIFENANSQVWMVK